MSRFTERLLQVVAQVNRVAPGYSELKENQFPQRAGSHLTKVGLVLNKFYSHLTKVGLVLNKFYSHLTKVGLVLNKFYSHLTKVGWVLNKYRQKE
jgi:hypothetical protein